ncbi:MAG: peptide ABC transporter substrate-binding protein [Opitutales bacterium]|nr:peptide ABC transporter substrate-binding protein [Opitutales bacterium]
MKPNPWMLFALVAAGLFTIIGCGPRETPAEKAINDRVLMINNGSEPRELDPHVVTGFPEYRVIKAILEGLVSEHPSDSNDVEPGVAERWESNEDSSVWTFYLREAQWSNGDPITAEDFVYAYRRILNPEFGAPYASMLYVMEGAQAYHEGELEHFDEVGVKALDEHTLEIRLQGPTPHFPLMLTHYTWFPLHQPTIESFGAFARRDTGWTQPSNHVGNGPFILVEWRPNQRITVAKNSYYWDVDQVELQAIEFYPIQDRQTEERMFQTGQLHKTDTVPFNSRDRYREREDPAFREDPFFATGYIGLNLNHEVLANPKVRKALSLAVDRDRIVERVTRSGRAAEGFVPPGIEGYPYRKHLEHDSEAARELLKEAGFPGGEGIPRLNMVVANVDTSRTLAEVLQSMWEQELGIRVQIQNREWQVLISDMDSGNFDFFLISWVGDYLDPATFLEIFRSGDGNNRTGFASETYDQKLRDSLFLADAEQRLRELADVEAYLMRELPIIPVSWSHLMYLLHPAVEGWERKRLGDQPYKHLRFRQSE